MTAAAPFRRIDLAAAPAGRVQMLAAVMGGPFETPEAAALATGLTRRAARIVAAELLAGLDAATISLAELLADHELESAARTLWAGADPTETLVVIAAIGPAKYIVAAGDLRLTGSVEAVERAGAMLKAETGAEPICVEINATTPCTIRALYGSGGEAS